MRKLMKRMPVPEAAKLLNIGEESVWQQLEDDHGPLIACVLAECTWDTGERATRNVILPPEQVRQIRAGMREAIKWQFFRTLEGVGPDLDVVVVDEEEAEELDFDSGEPPPRLPLGTALAAAKIESVKVLLSEKDIAIDPATMLTRAAIENRYDLVKNWRSIFAHEDENGLAQARVPGTEGKPRYHRHVIEQWLVDKGLYTQEQLLPATAPASPAAPTAASPSEAPTLGADLLNPLRRITHRIK